MKFKTAEEKLLADYEALEAENEQLKADLEKHEISDPETDQAAYRIDRPVELVRTNVDTYWYSSDSNGVAKMTAGELREACATRDGLVRIAEMNGRYGGKTAGVDKRVWPYQVQALGALFAVDFSKYSDDVNMSEVLIYDPAELDTSHWFPVECESGLYELALEELKEALLKRADKLENEAKEVE